MIRETCAPPLPRHPSVRFLSILLLSLFLGVSSRGVAATTSDDYLAGYIASILERELNWLHADYELQVDRGMATITLKQDDHARHAQAAERLKNLHGLQAVHFKIADAGAGAVVAARTSADAPDPGTAYPLGNVFRPLLADPRQPHFYISLREYDLPNERMTTAAVGLGETFGLYRFEGRAPGDGVQISVDGGVFALFNLDEPNRELVNADYRIGLPLTWRQGDNAARLSLYHQSSHLGDGYLLRVQPQVLLLTYEALSFLFSHDWQGLRVYLGGEYRFDNQPADFKPWLWQGGAEYYGTKRLWGGTRLVAGADIKSLQQHGYALDINVQIGLESGGGEPGQRRVRVMLEAYRGYSPDGQLYPNFMTAYGLGVHFGF